MIATAELSKIFKTGCIDNSQVSCLADALIGYVDEAFACRFINKLLDDLEISCVSTFPKQFVREKFIEVNNLWKRQSWSAKHRLVDAEPGAAMAAVKVNTARIAYTAIPSTIAGVVSVSSTEFERANNARDELVRKLDKVNEELNAAIEAKSKAEVALDEVKKECADVRTELDVAKKKPDETVRTVTELKVEKAKNEAMINLLKVAFPGQIISLANKLTKVMPPTVGARRVIYLYLGMITADPIDEAAFGSRFKLFDDELYLLFKDDPARLKQARDMFAADLNPRLTGRQVTWDFLGHPFNTEKFSTSDSFGTEVTEVISALITKPNGSVVRRAKVKTEDINEEN